MLQEIWSLWELCGFFMKIITEFTACKISLGNVYKLIPTKLEEINELKNLKSEIIEGNSIQYGENSHQTK